MNSITAKIRFVLSTLSVDKWELLKELDASSLGDLAARFDWSEALSAILDSDAYLTPTVRQIYADFLRRDSDPASFADPVFAYRTGGGRFCLIGLLASDEYWHRIGGAESRSFLSAAWRDLTGRDDPADLSELAAALDREELSRHAAISALIERPAIAERESDRLWNRLTGRTDSAPEAVSSAFARGGREGAIRAICDHPAFADHVAAVTHPYVAPDGHAAGVYPMDVYPSYEGSDLALLRGFSAPDLQPADGYFTDFLGRITDCRFLASIEHLDGKVAPHIPVPHDHFHAETIEYLGLLMAFDTLDRDAFVCAEFGAGWGPWTAAAGVIARRRGVGQVSAVAVEASLDRIGLLNQHLRDNGLEPDGVSYRCVHGAVWTSDGEVQFPSDPVHDLSGAAAENRPDLDYRGGAVDHVAVPAYTVETLLGDHDIVDFMHIDIQGAEADVCERSIAFLTERVRYLFIATHSRFIEGRLITLLRSNGFEILREKPCRFSFDKWTGSLEGLTTSDGGQLWRNPKFA